MYRRKIFTICTRLYWWGIGTGLAYIPEKIDSKACRNYISIFNKVFLEVYPEETFDFTEYLLVQNAFNLK